MAQKLYIGNLPFSATEESIRALFEPIGQVVSVTLIKDTHSGRPRGFGFLEMENAEQAVADLNGREVEGRAMKVDLARERTDFRSGGPGRGRPREGRGGGGYRGGRDR